jgi:Prolyl oligopeptidase family
MLIDYLPSYLFPNDENEIVDWGVCGVSLGGHAVWICLSQGTPFKLHILTGDDRITWGCSIIGCPSYIELIEYRLRQSGLPVQQPYLPQSFLRILEREDPGTILQSKNEIPISLKQKQILVLAGQEDRLVPWTACTNFVSALQQQSQKIQVRQYEGVGHTYHPEMMRDFYNWFIKFL